MSNCGSSESSAIELRFAVMPTAAAITAAVNHATGVRVRELPVKIENLLT
jgi:hypothetical protein